MGSDPIYFDAVGTGHAAAGANARIACLVPSITELLCDLGMVPQLVARTGFCIHPKSLVEAIPKVGGTKDVDIDKLRMLAPTHVIVNIDENEKPTVEAIAAFVPHVVVTHPNAPLDNLALYRLLGGIFGRSEAAEQLCTALEAALGAALGACATLPRERVLYLIWKDPWMTVAPETYIARTLAVVGWETVPAAAGVRYPAVELSAVAAGADRVLLSSEPYMFREPHLHQNRAQLPGKAVSLIDGEWTSLYGCRAISGLRELAHLRETLARSS